ncbi:MAG TPA: metallophosphoesterase [Pseudonocardia sp.]|uniref:metallophosphoesterase n=1 Tax=Pseudonocardia sp. TaxID=60912 RepID=UPI002B6D7194|nr:metallophosphoesterase [Pseudonocardia sp.]HTF53646.1 metallophosphoesterase [Pseudonocardia sp.]
MSVFYTSDLHFDHVNIIPFCGRPFESVFMMNSTIVENWNRVVKDDDTVYVLGDVTGGGLSGLRWVSLLNGRKILVAGNHDQCHPMHANWIKAMPKYRDAGFDEIVTHATRTINKRRVLLSHFPYSADHTDKPRFAQYRFPDQGLPLIHGHVHKTYRKDGHQLHVGVDAWRFAPVPEYHVVEWLDGLELAA